jgi:NAD-dependent deacetylase
MMDKAINIVTNADVIVLIGTSLQVYPAAGLMDYARTDCPVFYIDPQPSIQSSGRVKVIPKIASEGMKRFIEKHLP